jgi:hypothetical protein
VELAYKVKSESRILEKEIHQKFRSVSDRENTKEYDIQPLLRICLLFTVILRLTLSILKPFNKFLSRLANLFAGGEVDVLLAGLGTPGFGNFLRDQIMLVTLKKNRRNLRDEVGFVLANESFDAAKESFLMALGSDHLLEHDGATGDLFDNAIIKDGLSKHGQGLVLLLNTEFFGLQEDIRTFKLGDATLFLGRLYDPTPQIIVDIALALTLFIVLEDEAVLEINS